MEIYFAGTGTSHGVPVIGCNCPVCRSRDPKNKRTRSSVFIRGSDGTSIVIDTGPDFRFQALKRNLCRLDALLLTHSHADHVHGIDDLRVFAHTKSQEELEQTGLSSDAKHEGEKPLAVYANRNTIRDIKERFAYIFSTNASCTQQGGGKPLLYAMEAENFCETSPLTIGTLSIVPVPIKHGSLNVCGWKITEKASVVADAGADSSCASASDVGAADAAKTGSKTDTGGVRSFAYLTDCSFIEDSSVSLVRGVQHLVIDALREKKHSTHLCFAESMSYAQKIGAQHTWFTHISHDSSHQAIIDWIRRNCPPGFYCPKKCDDTDDLQNIFAQHTQNTGTKAKLNTVAPAFDALVLRC